MEVTLPGGELNEIASAIKYSENSNLAATLVDHGAGVTDRYVAFQETKRFVDVYGTSENTRKCRCIDLKGPEGTNAHV